MNHKLAGTAIAAILALGSPLAAASPADAARCVSGADVRHQVADFVHSLRDDVATPTTRGHVKAAFNETMKTLRGAKADTPKENRGLGREISALAKLKKDAADQVARAAINAEIHALQEQKREAHLTARDVKQAEKDLKRLSKHVRAATDTRGEGRQVAAFVHAFMAQFDC